MTLTHSVVLVFRPALGNALVEHDGRIPIAELLQPRGGFKRIPFGAAIVE